MTSIKSNHKTAVSVAVTLLMIVLGLVALFWFFNAVEKAAAVRKTNILILSEANSLLSAMKDAETSGRGYVLTSDEAYLVPYLSVRDGINARLKELRRLSTNTSANKQLDILFPLIQAKLAQVAYVVDLTRHQKTAAAQESIRVGQGKQLMDSIRLEMNSFIAIQEAILLQDDEVFNTDMRRLFMIIVITSLLVLAFSFLLVFVIYQQSKQKLQNTVHLETQNFLKLQQEISSRLQAANFTLRESESKLAITLNSIGDAVIATDGNAIITLMNPVAEQLTGWKESEAKGLLIADVFRIINKDSRKEVVIPIIDALAHGTIQGLANHTLLIARDKSERDIADSCALIRDSEGLVSGAVLVFRDITEEYAVQKIMRDNTALIETILSTAVDGIVAIHASGGLIEKVNPAAERMFGYTAAELAGQNFSFLIPELDKDQQQGSLAYYSASDKARASGLQREVVGKHKDGSTFPMEIAISEMWLGGQRFFTGVLRNLTARKRVEEERAQLDYILHEKNIELESAKLAAEKANLAKSDFLSSMSHELRTPLNAILGFTQLIESGIPKPTPNQKRSIDQILKAGWYLLELINEILDLALIESGKLSLSLEPMSLSDVLHECQTMIEPEAKRREITLIFPPLNMLYYVKADRTRVKQVLINLLSNAIKYNSKRGAVTVSYSVTDSGVIRILLEDTGEGLSAEKLAQLFQPFNRLGQELKAEEGTGIGLVMTKRLIELMGGQIGVESTVGKGSVFWIELALSNKEQIVADDDEAIAINTGVEKHARLYTMLYVEDNPANLMLVEEIIKRRLNIRLISAKDGKHGIEIARTCLPDIILMDINLPGISGIQALQILSRDPTTKHIPVLALSANAMPRDIEMGLEAGFFRYLTKPIKVNEFMDTLDEALLFTQSARTDAEEEFDA